MQPIPMKLNLSKEGAKRQTATVRCGEINSTTLKATIYDHADLVDLSPYDVYLEMVHPNGRCASVRCETDGSTAALVFDGRTAAVPGTVELAYIALKQHADDGTQTLCATTQAFAVEVLPDAASEGCGIAEAYSSEIVEMLLLCKRRYEEAEAARDADYEANEQRREDRFAVAVEEADAAAGRANDAADKVDEALSGNLDPLFKQYLDALKDAEGGFVKWETYLEGIRNAGTPDNETIEKDAENRLRVRDYGIPYGKLAGIPFPFLPNVWELEDLTIRCGTFANAGAGWNTFTFPEPFEAVPMVVVEPMSGSGMIVNVINVTKDGFQYCLFETVNPVVSTGTYYTASGTSSSSSHSAVTLVSSVSGGVLRTTGFSYRIGWIAIEDGREG